MSDLIQENNKQLMESFKDLLTETVGQIQRANEYLAEQQMKEIKKLKYNEPRKSEESQRRPVSKDPQCRILRPCSVLGP